MKLKVTNVLLPGFALALALLGGVAWLNWGHNARMEAATESLAKTHELQANLNHFLSLLQDIETGARGFVITGDPSFLEPFQNGLKEVGEQQRKVAALVHNAKLEKHLAELEPLIGERIARSKEAIQLRQTSGFAAAKQNIAQGQGKAVMNKIRLHFAQMDELMRPELAKESAAARRELDVARWMTLAGIGLSFALLTAVFAVARNENQLRKGAQKQMARHIDDLAKANVKRQAAEASLRHSRAVVENLFQSLPGPVLVLTPELQIAEAIDAYLTATMTTREGLLGRGLFEAFPDNPDDAGATGTSNLRASLDRVRQNLKADTMAIQKYDIRRNDGTFEVRYWSPINSPVFGPDRGMEYIIHRVEDVTDFVLKRTAAGFDDGEMRQQMEKMEAEVFLSSQKVQAINQQLQAANQELEAFSYSVSHDLRAPLRHIHGYVEMLSKATQGQLSEKAVRYLQTIASASAEMGHLIDDLLEFSRMGRVVMIERPVDLNSLVKDTRRSLEMEVQGRNIEWNIAPLPVVSGDASMLRQVLANLLGNAVKYTRPRNPAKIEIGTAGEEDGRTIFFVRDNGAGFDMKYADKLFGVFQRLHRADEFEGTGIGLATVRRIIARHGGRTSAEGRPGEGACLYFTLKLSEEVSRKT